MLAKYINGKNNMHEQSLPLLNSKKFFFNLSGLIMFLHTYACLGKTLVTLWLHFGQT